MKQLKFACLLVLIVGITACTSNKSKMISKIDTLENEMKAAKESFDKQKAAELMKLYVEYSDTYKKDTIVATYLFKAGELSMNMNNPQKALELFERVYKEHPDYQKAADCMFLKGFIYDNMLQDLEKAKNAYIDFIKKYPTHAFADDAQVLLQNLGKSPEELIKQFEEKNQANTAK
jgi:TolA-binding protein